MHRGTAFQKQNNWNSENDREINVAKRGAALYKFIWNSNKNRKMRHRGIGSKTEKNLEFQKNKI